MILIEIKPNGAKVTPGDPKSEKMAPQGERKGTNWVQKRAKMKPMGRQKEPRAGKGVAKVSQRSQVQQKGCQKWAKGLPKSIKNSIFGKGCENAIKMVTTSYTFWFLLEQFSITNPLKKQCKD